MKTNEKKLLFDLENKNDLIFSEINDFICYLWEKIISIIENNLWDVHSVYKVTTEANTYFLKVRDSYCKKYHSIILNPLDINKEIQSIKMLYNLFPNNFPKVLYTNIDKTSFLMTDVINSWDYFINKLNWPLDILVLKKHIVALSKIIWEIHFILSSQRQVNIVNDSFDDRLIAIFWWTNFWDSILQDLKNRENQYILWDLSPKNIWFNELWNPVFFDLEYFSIWNSTFEIAFLLAHIYLHLYSYNFNQEFIELFLENYIIKNPDFKVDDLFWRIFYWTLLYRVWISPMKYNVSLSQEDILIISKTSKKYLEKSLL